MNDSNKIEPSKPAGNVPVPSGLNKKITDLEIYPTNSNPTESTATDLIQPTFSGQNLPVAQLNPIRPSHPSGTASGSDRTDAHGPVREDNSFDHARPLLAPPPIVADGMENFAAVGGSVAAVIIGSWGLLALTFTSWSFFNGLIGLPLGIWGLASANRKLAVLGIGLCLLTMLLALFRLLF